MKLLFWVFMVPVAFLLAIAAVTVFPHRDEEQ